jgi:hypothetical protein
LPAILAFYLTERGERGKAKGEREIIEFDKEELTRRNYGFPLQPFL